MQVLLFTLNLYKPDSLVLRKVKLKTRGGRFQKRSESSRTGRSTARPRLVFAPRKSRARCNKIALLGGTSYILRTVITIIIHTKYNTGIQQY